MNIADSGAGGAPVLAVSPHGSPDGIAVEGFSSHRIARNSVLYFVSLVVPAVAALIFVPVSVRALGPARFGLLALAWAIAESTGIFDFGLGKATIRFVADASARSRERLQDVVVASLITQTSMGALAGLVFYLITPLLIHRVFTIVPANAPEALGMFRVVALHMPVLLFIASLRASLEGAERFDISTPLRLPGSVASVVVPAWAAFAGYSLTAIMWMLLAVRVILALATAIAVRQVLDLEPRDVGRHCRGFNVLRPRSDDNDFASGRSSRCRNRWSEIDRDCLPKRYDNSLRQGCRLDAVRARRQSDDDVIAVRVDPGGVDMACVDICEGDC
jgi:hypothetical protein